MADEIFHSQVSNGRELVMGFGVLWLVILGAVVGQVALLTNIVVWVGYFQAPQIWLVHLVEGAVRLALQDCFGTDWLQETTTTTTTPESVFWPDFSLAGGWLTLTVRVEIVLICVAAGFSILPCLFWLRRKQREDQTEGLVDSPPSPVSSDLNLAVLARNQLAEVRLRRHGPGREVRALGI